MNFLKIMFIYIILIFTTFILSIYLGLTTSIGAIIILKTLNTFYSNQYINKLNINLNKLTGNIIDGLNIKGINYHNGIYNIEINNLEVKINLLNYLYKKKIHINIYNLSGYFNHKSITGKIDLEIYKGCIKIHKNNFIKIGNNILNLSTALNNNDETINFKLNIDEISLFIPKYYGNLNISGEISAKLDSISTKIYSNKFVINNKNIGNLLASSNNDLKVKILFKPKPIVIIEPHLTDLSNLTDFMPEVSRCKGQLLGMAKIDFNSSIPKITTDLSFQNISMALPIYGIKIKPLNINLIANDSKFINLNAKGVMRNGPGTFEISGVIKPFDMKKICKLKIISNDIEFINTPEYHLIGKLNLTLTLLKENILNIHGDINILKGLINLGKQPSKIVQSKDIIFINSNRSITNTIDIYGKNNSNKSNNIKINPDIDLRIEENTYLKGIGFNANITGKLKIYIINEDYDNWLGNGRITIKQGIYILSNQKFLIDKGRMIYLPGTLLNNPILDIKVLANQAHFTHKSNEKYLYIEGTLNNPIIRDLGLIDEKQAILQILNLGNNPITSNIKEKLKLSEFGIQDNDYETSKEFKELNEQQSFLDNKNFVLGKKISKRIDFKYFKTLNTNNNTIKLKYNFNKNFSFEIESSTIDGYGTDFYFFKEIK